MSRRKIAHIGSRALVCALALAVMVGSGLVRAQNTGDDWTAQLFTGNRNAAVLRQAMEFKDLPQDPAAAAAIERLAAQGVLRGDGRGSFAPNAALTREQALVALIRLLGWEDLALQYGADNSDSGSDISPWAAGFVALASAQGLFGDKGAEMMADGESDLPWTGPVSRQEVAAWCVRALELADGVLISGGPFSLAAYSDAETIEPNFTAAVELALRLELLAAKSDSQLSTDKRLILPRGPVTRGELALILDRLVRMLPAPESYSWEVATLDGVIKEREEVSGMPARSDIWMMTRPDGSSLALKLSFLEDNNPLLQTVVLKNNRLRYGDALNEGDTIRYLLENGKTVSSIEVLPHGLRTVRGYIQQINPTERRLIIRDNNLIHHDLPLAPAGCIRIGPDLAQMSDLAVGLEVTATVLDQLVSQIVALRVAEPVVGEPAKTEISGQVRLVDSDSLVVVRAEGSTARYDVNSSTLVTVGGHVSTPAAIQPGDFVQIQLLTPTSTWAKQVVVANMRTHEAQLIRGELGSFSPYGNNLLLRSVQRLNSGLWENVAPSVSLPLRPDATLWYENEEIDLPSAAKLPGAQMYAAVSSGFGRQEVLRAVIWQGLETAYTGSIDKLNPGLGYIALSQGELILSPGAIVIKDGRLADLYGLVTGDSVQALVRRSAGQSVGLAVSVLGQEDDPFPGITVYRAALDKLGSTALTLASGQSFSQGVWSRRSRNTEQLAVGRDILVLSMLDYAPKRLTLPQLQQEFWQDLLTDSELLVVEEAGDALALALWPEGELDAVRLSRGQIVAVTEAADEAATVNLTNVASYSPAKEAWEYGESPEEVQLGVAPAVVIKNGRAVGAQHLAVGDHIVFLQRGQTAVLARVKE